MRKLLILVSLILLTLTSCDKISEHLIDDIKSQEKAAVNGSVDVVADQDNIILNDDTTDSDNDDILADTFFLNYETSDYKFESEIVADCLQISIYNFGDPNTEFKKFNSKIPNTALTACSVVDIKAINLRMIDDDNELAFEINYSGSNKKYTISDKYKDKIGN